ncbi:MAG TPA: non-canonical purine NTP pyrophosphatase [Gemmatimonadaceae bacterium]|nr:non-canonical purine NTP pyrophosphatase [Gemmatimonadaceae bacterium]
MRSAGDATRRVLLATRSAGKLHELKPIIVAAGFDPITLIDAGIPEIPAEAELEHEPTFEENALSKALYFHGVSGLPTVADDSGIEVAALGGAPGVRSKRWSGREDLVGHALDDANNALLLRMLERSPDRRAKYVCAAAYSGRGWELVERGEVQGAITRAPRGTNGFGYDPYFESAELGRTFGEVAMEEKARVSHRARAFAKLLRRMQSLG